MARNIWKPISAAAVLSLALLITFLLQKQVNRPVFSVTSRHSLSDHPWAVDKGRKVYPFSVIPGGAYSPEELQRSRRIDPTVARHYAGFGNTVLVQKTVHETYMYVSYRKKDRVYWTQTKRRIPSGEYVLTDGKNFARARCGNRLSAVPQEPIADADEPDDNGLNQPEPPKEIYFADIEPTGTDPVHSLLSPTLNEPMLDALNQAPKAIEQAMQQGSSFASPFWTGGGGAPYPRSKQTSGTTPNSSVPPETLPVSPAAIVPTPEPRGLGLAFVGGFGMCFWATLRKRKEKRG